MKLLPVMDLKADSVVRAVAGRRYEYQPVPSQLADDASPAGIARAFKQSCGFQQVYVADLDAIAGGEPNWDTYESIADSGLRLVLDAGITN